MRDFIKSRLEKAKGNRRKVNDNGWEHTAVCLPSSAGAIMTR